MQTKDAKIRQYRIGLAVNPIPKNHSHSMETVTTLPLLSVKYPLRILLAEDNAINQQLAMIILTKMGYRPEMAENGKEVLEKLREKEFDLIFMDVQMPEMDGLEATRNIRAVSWDQPLIIAVTANVTRKHREVCLAEGMNDYLSKPINLEELIEVLKKCGRAVQIKRKKRA